MPNLPSLTAAPAAATPPPVVEESCAVRVRGVRKSFGDTPVLFGADLDVEAGHITALLGPSGCGKTTLLRVIAGLETPDSGTVSVGGRVLTGPGVHLPTEQRRVGLVFQDWALFPHMTVARNVGFGLTRAERRSGRIEEALELVELHGLADRLPSTLSGGQQQRVALARALAHRPEVLLLDEPFSNLDANLRGSVRSEVIRLLRSLSLTTVVVTHDQEEAFAIGDSVAVMLDGRVAQQGAPRELYDHPADRRVAAFVGDANLLTGAADGTRAVTPIGAIELDRAHHGLVEVVLRPEQLHVCAGGDGIVESVEYYGHDALYLVRSGGAQIRARVLSAPTFAVGDRVHLEYVGGPATGYARS